MNKQLIDEIKKCKGEIQSLQDRQAEIFAALLPKLKPEKPTTSAQKKAVEDFLWDYIFNDFEFSLNRAVEIYDEGGVV